jgi:hypothetical protein
VDEITGLILQDLCLTEAVSHYIEHQTGWSIKKFVRTARRYRTVHVKSQSASPDRRRPTNGSPP